MSDELPVSRRLRALALARVQAIAERHPAALRALRRMVPAAAWRIVRRAGAPVRIPEASPTARLSPVEIPPPADPPSGPPQGPLRATIVVPAYRAADRIGACLSAIRRHTEAPAYEVVVVDDASGDGTDDVVRAVASSWPALRLVVREANGGFSAAVNEGARGAAGDVLVFVNDDAIVAPGWLARLVARLDADASLGLVSAVSNDSGDGGTIAAAYDGLGELLDFAARLARENAGRVRELPKVALLCAAIRRATFEAEGGLDESFTPGMFEDDDLCHRLRRAGLTVGVAPDAYVHHAGGAALRGLGAARYLAAFEENRLRFERKWGVRWQPP